MRKIILADNTEMEIKSGTGLESITAVANDFTALGTFVTALRTKGNLKTVQFAMDESITDEYEDMVLMSPLFYNVNIVGGKVEATFALREKTEIEKRLDELEESQSITDGAVVELAEIIGGE